MFTLFNSRMETYQLMNQIARRGIRFDHQLRKRMRGESRAKLRVLEKELRALAKRPELNLNSSPQLKKLVYDDWKIKPYMNRKTHQPTLDETALKKLAVKYPKNQFFTKLIDYREEHTKYTRYLNVKIDHDNRIRCMYGLAKTGRLRSTSNPFWTGANLQNIPSEMKCLFLADIDHVLVEVDLSQAEARIVAYESGDPAYIKLFEDGGDIHRANAANIFGKRAEDITKKERQLGKRVAHATNYKVGPRTMCESIIKDLGTEYAIAERDAKAFQFAYHQQYVKVKEWHKRIEQQLKLDRTLTNCFGTKYYFLGPIDDKTIKEAIATIPQGTIADLISYGIKNWEAKHSNNAPILGQVHDSALISINENDWNNYRDTIIKYIKQCFEIPITINGEEITIPCDIKVGKDWLNMEEATQ